MADEHKAIYLEKVPTKGRPKLILTADGERLVEALAGYMCTDEEIADTLGTTVDTLTNANNKGAFSESKRKGQAKGKVSLRRFQWKLAERYPAMAIFLGKKYLGQRDDPDIVPSADDPVVEMLKRWDDATGEQ